MIGKGETAKYALAATWIVGWFPFVIEGLLLSSTQCHAVFFLSVLIVCGLRLVLYLIMCYVFVGVVCAVLSVSDDLHQTMFCASNWREASFDKPPHISHLPGSDCWRVPFSLKARLYFSS